MFKVIITEWFGPFGGKGGYGSERIVAFGKSPKIAKERATLHKHRNSVIRQVHNNCGGGVPILGSFILMKDNKVLISEMS